MGAPGMVELILICKKFATMNPRAGFSVKTGWAVAWINATALER